MNESDYEPQERRPIASRELAISHRIAGWLAQRQVSPNTISVAGMLAAILGGLAFSATSLDCSWSRWFWLGGAIAAQLRLLANMFDGMVAVLRNVASPLGELYNEVPDRVSDSGTCSSAWATPPADAPRWDTWGRAGGCLHRVRTSGGQTRRGAARLLRTDGQTAADVRSHAAGRVLCRRAGGVAAHLGSRRTSAWQPWRWLSSCSVPWPLPAAA